MVHLSPLKNNYIYKMKQYQLEIGGLCWKDKSYHLVEHHNGHIWFSSTNYPLNDAQKVITKSDFMELKKEFPLFEINEDGAITFDEEKALTEQFRSKYMLAASWRNTKVLDDSEWAKIRDYLMKR